MANEDKNIELRSEKVRNITGKIPSVFIRYGIGIVALTLLVLLIISLIVPYREIVNLSITFYSEPNTELIKSPHSGTAIIDTAGLQKDSVQVYIQTKNNIYAIYRHAAKNILFSVKNRQFVDKNEILFIINPGDNFKIFGIADITKNDSKKIKTGQAVNIIAVDDINIQGVISDIYAINPEQSKYRLKISIDRTDKIYFDSKYEGNIVISEKTLFYKIFN
ncbi:MAG: HlyD family secretion protein [Prevotellaceae bacterium]|jgi:hypothetical protein|nr:HlyD family secretion protein [Prevotellaceae bacterium]